MSVLIWQLFWDRCTMVLDEFSWTKNRKFLVKLFSKLTCSGFAFIETYHKQFGNNCIFFAKKYFNLSRKQKCRHVHITSLSLGYSSCQHLLSWWLKYCWSSHRTASHHPSIDIFANWQHWQMENLSQLNCRHFCTDLWI